MGRTWVNGVYVRGMGRPWVGVWVSVWVGVEVGVEVSVG